MTSDFLLKQMEWLQILHKNRPAFLDPFFQSLHYLDTTPAYLCMCALLLLFMGWRAGVNIFTFALIGIVLNKFAKNIFEQPRPFFIDPTLALSSVPSDSYGFPSGGAMGSIMIALVLYYYFPKRSILILGICYTLLISFSRVYLGVHFFTDILGGWALALIYAFIYLKVLKKISRV